MKLTSFHEKRLVGSMVLSQKIFLQDSICMPCPWLLSLGSDSHKLVMDSPPTFLIFFLDRDIHVPPYARTDRTTPVQAAQAP
ncbi:hypothetical protein V6N11_024763 [Hibiscus sabdariffa]|uniref:Uncharacterized protein n=1 Tax=Hibiscus sabdariffa TaxID=183260 RepID=A0ABR2QN89_9ROSI